jgi:hypothetical protein
MVLVVHGAQYNGGGRTTRGVVPTPYCGPDERVQASKSMHTQETERKKTGKNTAFTILMSVNASMHFVMSLVLS